jgi:hypothetical protein
MFSLLDMITLDIGDNPDVTWVFSKRITGISAGVWPFKMFFPRVFLRYPDRV